LKKTLKIFSQIILFVLLTILTQIGGLIYLLNKPVNKKINWNSRLKPILTFILLYLLASFLIIPIIAPLFGREPIKHTKTIQATSYMTVLLNRNYVKPEMNGLLLRAEQNLEGTNIQINYLDANFPFIDRFPLLPHLSHNDGKKLDISLTYETKEGQISEKLKSNSGYGVFEEPRTSEHNQAKLCLEKGYLQYDYPKYMTFGTKNEELKFSEKGTKRLIQAILKEDNLGKLFIEPHLKERLNLDHSKIRYHGCRAVRHDDHIHIQLK